MRSLHRFLVDEGTVDEDPTGDVAGPRVPQGIPKALTEDEIDRLLDAVTGDDAAARRDRAMLEVLYGAGLRISEAVGLRLSDLDLASHTMRVLRQGGQGARGPGRAVRPCRARRRGSSHRDAA